MSVISSKDVNDIIIKTLSMINPNIIQHGEITGYILYKMLVYENRYTEQELVDYTMIGILHDIGIYKENDVNNVADYEAGNPWAHSVYGFLFLKYLSPIGDKAQIVLYHHLDYNRYGYINTKYQRVLELLCLADKMDNYMHNNGSMEKDYFVRYRNIKFSADALDVFFKAEKQFNITAKLASGEYMEELAELLSRKVFSETYKKGFLEMLVYSIDFQSEHTVVHTMATVNFAIQLGNLKKLNSTEMRNLYYGALLHDIGKVAIPLEILESTGRLNDDEMTIMKKHVEYTENILRGVVNDEVLEIAIRHHEKLDGTGYHRGVSGEDLTLPQKIVAVADILSALYGKRSYKDAFDSTTIKQILVNDAQKNKISQTVVDCLMSNYNQIIQNYEKEKQNMIGLYLTIKEQYDVIIKKFQHL